MTNKTKDSFLISRRALALLSVPLALGGVSATTFASTKNDLELQVDSHLRKLEIAEIQNLAERCLNFLFAYKAEEIPPKEALIEIFYGNEELVTAIFTAENEEYSDEDETPRSRFWRNFGRAVGRIVDGLIDAVIELGKELITGG